MSSTIFYRFKSQKNTSKILFDGTGITVFDLKREIILVNKLGDGSGFQLRLYNPDSNEEYEDDSYVIPRSSMIIAVRSPAEKSSNGLNNARVSMGNAMRYTMGKPRVVKTGVMPLSTVGMMKNIENMTEEERIENMFANQESQWQQAQQEMSQATPVFHRPTNTSLTDDAPPPPGYMCYRCGGKDHWIKNCPTNSDPNFEGKRIRRTTGIPKKFLKTIEIDPNTMTAEEMAERKIMVTDDGKFVVQIADQQSWEDYQRKQQAVVMNGKDALWQQGHFQDLPKDLKCPLTGGLFRDPVKTDKCCKKVFSRLSIEDYLLESDFICPECKQTDILLDSLIPDNEVSAKVKEFLEAHEVKRPLDEGNENTEETPKKQKLIPPAIPIPPFGMPFPMFPIPFMPMPQAPQSREK